MEINDEITQTVTKTSGTKLTMDARKRVSLAKLLPEYDFKNN